MRNLGAILALAAVGAALAGCGVAALALGVFAGLCGLVAWLGEIIELSEES